MKRAPMHRRSGFTLIELTVVVAIVGIMLGLMLPAIQSARESARRANCVSHQRQVGLAILGYEVATGAFPPGRVGCDDTGETQPLAACPPGLPPEEKTAASGFISILPQLGYGPLFDQLAVEEGGLWNRNVDDLTWYEDPSKCRGVKQRIALYVCPSDDAATLSDVYDPVLAATSSYAFSQGTLGPGAPPLQVKYENDGLFVYVSQREQRHVVDGLSHTMLLGEVVLADTWESSNTWSYALAYADCLRTTTNPLNTRPGAGTTVQRQNAAFGSHHPGGANFCFGDGHVKFVADGIEQVVYREMSTIAGSKGTPVGDTSVGGADY